VSRLELQTGGPHSRLVCLGDCHGDRRAFERQLQVARVVDADGKWCGGSDVLVQIGDVLDRGIGELDILLRLADLTQQAAAAGGRVVQLMGNHELMNYCGDWRYVSGPWGDGFAPFDSYLTPALDEKAPGWRELPALAKQPYAVQARAAAFDMRVPCLIDEIRPFRMANQVAVIVGDTLCVHGGLAMPHLDYVGGFDALNQEAEEWVGTGGDGSGRAPPLLEHPNGPLWMRIFSNPSDVSIPQAKAGSVGARQLLYEVLAATGCSRMVVGHTPQNFINRASIVTGRGEVDGGIEGRESFVKDQAGLAEGEFAPVDGGEVWRIDTGASSGIASGPIEVLEVTSDGVVSVLTEASVDSADGAPLNPEFFSRCPKTGSMCITIPADRREARRNFY